MPNPGLCNPLSDAHNLNRSTAKRLFFLRFLERNSSFAITGTFITTNFKSDQNRYQSGRNVKTSQVNIGKGDIARLTLLLFPCPYQLPFYNRYPIDQCITVQEMIPRIASTFTDPCDTRYGHKKAFIISKPVQLCKVCLVGCVIGVY